MVDLLVEEYNVARIGFHDVTGHVRSIQTEGRQRTVRLLGVDGGQDIVEQSVVLTGGDAETSGLGLDGTEVEVEAVGRCVRLVGAVRMPEVLPVDRSIAPRSVPKKPRSEHASTVPHIRSSSTNRVRTRLFSMNSWMR